MSRNGTQMAFPTASTADDADKGMALRDYFAGQALAGMLSQKQAFECPNQCGEWSYQFADAMLKARDE